MNSAHKRKQTVGLGRGRDKCKDYHYGEKTELTEQGLLESKKKNVDNHSFFKDN